MQKLNYKIINGITIYRIVAAPFLLFLVFTNNLDLFKWFLAVSFFTDLIDGYLARRFNVVSLLGSRIDSLGDDLTIFAAIIAVFVFKLDFIRSQLLIVSALLALFILQHVLALIRYQKITSFHTYLAKIAAIFQGSFFILLFFIHKPIYVLFYLASFLTFLDLAEEIILIFLLPNWEANVKGIYWVIKKKT